MFFINAFSSSFQNFISSRADGTGRNESDSFVRQNSGERVSNYSSVSNYGSENNSNARSYEEIWNSLKESVGQELPLLTGMMEQIEENSEDQSYLGLLEKLTENFCCSIGHTPLSQPMLNCNEFVELNDKADRNLMLFWKHAIPEDIQSRYTVDGESIGEIADKISKTIEKNKISINVIAMIPGKEITLEMLPKNVAKLNPEHIKMNKCGIESVPMELKDINRLKIVNLSGNLLKEMPEVMKEMKQKYVVVDISNNKISVYPDTIGNFIREKDLSIAGKNKNGYYMSIAQFEKVHRLL